MGYGFERGVYRYHGKLNIPQVESATSDPNRTNTTQQTEVRTSARPRPQAASPSYQTSKPSSIVHRQSQSTNTGS